MQRRHEGQTKHVKQGSLSSSSSNSTVSSIASKYDVNQLKKEISQAKSRVRKCSRSFHLLSHYSLSPLHAVWHVVFETFFSSSLEEWWSLFLH